MLTNVAVLTEGFDDPGVSCVAMARPTRSEGLYAQCVGRGTRLAPGKTDCLILDFVDLSDARACARCRRCSARRAISTCAAATPARRAARGCASSSITRASSSRPARSRWREIQDRAASFDPLTLAHRTTTCARSRATRGSRSAATASACTSSARRPRQRGARPAPRRPRQVLGGRHRRPADGAVLAPGGGRRGRRLRARAHGARRDPHRPRAEAAWQAGRAAGRRRRRVRAPRTSASRCA